MNIGFDFGSTYSTVAKYNPATGTAEAITPTEGASASIPSVVSISKKGVVTSGAAAKEQMGKRTVRIFEAFKMLLNESSRDMLLDRGYDDQYNPQVITKYFLEGAIQSVLEREKCDKVDKMVICVPEIWWSKAQTLDGRAILRSILREELEKPVSDVRVVTEPEAASAFIAYNYERETKKSFNGHLLLIDYGGGTLDLTLTEVVSDGKGAMEISFRESGGAGENHPDAKGNRTIGKAGIAYMQNVVVRALEDAGLLEPDAEVDYNSPDFVAAVKDLEGQLKSSERIRDIAEVFGAYGKYSKFKKILKKEPIEFISLEYEGEEVPVTYQQLLLSYQEVNEGVLQAELDRITDLTIQHFKNVKGGDVVDPREPAAGARDDFKIAMVGGFCSFYLVRQQIAEIYNLNANQQVDLRVNAVAADKQEQAIALGAALLAEGKVELKRTARFSIGIFSRGYDGRHNLYYGIKYRQQVEPGTPYFLCFDESKDDVPENRLSYHSILNNIEYFAMGYSSNRKSGFKLRLKEEMIQKLRQIPDLGVWNLGFSMDESEVISFHVVPVERYLDAGAVPPPSVITLGRISNLFELTDSREVTVP